MNEIDSFVNCHDPKAIHRVNLKHYVSSAPHGRSCFARLEEDLLLCDACAKFWLEHQGVRDDATLIRALQLRKGIEGQPLS